MGRNKNEKRRAFFEQGVKAFQNISGISEQWYVCPLCKHAFTERHLEDKTLTFEHVPPQRLGGKELVLTCGKCNGAAGTKLDSHAFTRGEVEAFVRKVAAGGSVGARQVRVGVLSHEVNGSFTIDRKNAVPNIRIEITGGQNNPGIIRKLEEDLREEAKHSATRGLKLHVRGKKWYNRHLAELSDLRSGYLAAFAKLGYRYAFHPSLDNVRKQLEHPDDDVIGGFWYRYSSSSVLALSDRPVEGLWVMMRHATVLLPWPVSKVDPYQRLAEMYVSGSQFRMHGQRIPWPKGPEMVWDFGGPIIPC